MCGHSNLNHVSPSELYSMTSPWPFSVWAKDVIGRIAPKVLNGHEYILVAIDYFTKWVEAVGKYAYTQRKVKRIYFIYNL